MKEVQEEEPIFEGNVNEIYDKLNTEFKDGSQTLYIKVNSSFHQQLPADL
jgi:hypothetical protein